MTPPYLDGLVHADKSGKQHQTSADGDERHADGKAAGVAAAARVHAIVVCTIVSRCWQARRHALKRR